MNKVQSIISQVADEARSQVEQAVELGDDRVSIEMEFGSGIIGVEYYPIHTSWGWMMIKDVYVAHERGTGESKRLTEALRKAVPEWSDIENDSVSEQDYNDYLREN